MDSSTVPDWDHLERTFTYRLHKLSKLTERLTQRGFEQESGLPAHEARCLTAIGSYAPLSVVDLAQCANLDKAQASRAAQALMQKGLVSKKVSPHDKRVLVLNLTEAGIPIWQKTMRFVTHRNQVITRILTPEQKQMFSDMLDLLIEDAAKPPPAV